MQSALTSICGDIKASTLRANVGSPVLAAASQSALQVPEVLDSSSVCMYLAAGVKVLTLFHARPEG